MENRPVSVTGGASFVYDGDGNRVKKTEGGQTILYINKYYEKNLTTEEVTTYYYLGGRLVAKLSGETLNYVHQDHLTGTSVTSDTNGASTGSIKSIKFYPYGSLRSGSVSTDKKFTGQRLDGTGLYYYNARYYDPEIGRFISADTKVPDPANPQALNRYSYVLNNPLKYTDPSGHGWWSIVTDIASIIFDVQQMISDPSWENVGWLALDVVLTVAPIVPAGAGPAAKGAGKVAKIFGKSEKVEGAGKVVEGAKTTGKATEQGVVLLAKTDRNFRPNLMRLTGKSEEAVKGKQAHHVLPLQKDLQKYFKEAGISINDPKYGAWVDNTYQNWSSSYQQKWEDFFKNNPEAKVEQIEDFARGLADEFMFEVNF